MRLERSEALARWLFILVLVGVPAGLFFATWQARQRGILVQAAMPENGGWSPEVLEAQVGVPLHIRLTSLDVLHGFAVGGIDAPHVEIEPGKISETTLVFHQPGRYVFYCTRWCGPNHWRMRGVIEVWGDSNPMPEVKPLYLQLGLDIDAVHRTEIVPIVTPSAAHGAALAAKLTIPEKYMLKETYLTHSPEQMWRSIRGESWAASLSAQDVWDLVAFMFFIQTSAQNLEQGEALYAANCAACHGERGDGRGDMSAYFAGGDRADADDAEHPLGHEATPPSNFTDREHMLAASPALLQGKIVRGGMGTGMPYWGPIFTDEQIWAIVAYLYTFQFDYGGLINE